MLTTLWETSSPLRPRRRCRANVPRKRRPPRAAKRAIPLQSCGCSSGHPSNGSSSTCASLPRLCRLCIDLRAIRGSVSQKFCYKQHQWVFPQVPTVASLAKESLKQGKCVVIGLQSTGEAHTERAVYDCIQEMIEAQVGFVSDHACYIYCKVFFLILTCYSQHSTPPQLQQLISRQSIPSPLAKLQPRERQTRRRLLLIRAACIFWSL